MKATELEAVFYGERMEAYVEISPNCPRCGSSNTKFCYYNNYSLTQPRYFCKGCRRYWTKGGSLRNVPVGGGCRKNRRGKSLLRLPIDGAPCNKSLSSDGAPCYDNKVNALSDSNTSSSMSDGSHIDLALLFANFLNNQQPENKSSFEVPELPTEFDPSREFPSLSNTNMESSLQLPEENGVTGCLTHSDFSTEYHLSNNDQIYHPGLDYLDRVQQCTGDETSNYALPPLPGDDLSSQEILWPNSHSSITHALHLQATQEPLLGPETQDPNLLFGNWSPFDLSSDDTFSTRT